MYEFLADLFAGPSPVIVVCIVLAAIVAAAAVFWTLARLLVDPRAHLGDEGNHDFLFDLSATRDTADEAVSPS